MFLVDMRLFRGFGGELGMLMLLASLLMMMIKVSDAQTLSRRFGEIC